jgi:hypothetical protein
MTEECNREILGYDLYHHGHNVNHYHTPHILARDGAPVEALDQAMALVRELVLALIEDCIEELAAKHHFGLAVLAHELGSGSWMPQLVLFN